MKEVVISRRRDKQRWYWFLRTTENGQVKCDRNTKYSTVQQAIAAARKHGGHIKFWNS